MATNRPFLSAGGASSLIREISRKRNTYVFVLPAVVFYLLFSYSPMYFLQIAFKDYRITRTVGASPWVGFKYFQQLFSNSGFWQAFWNTLTISGGKLLFSWPVPIILALMLNEITSQRAKKVYQTVIYLPHFISWVVISGIIYNLTAMPDGLVNKLIVLLGGQPMVILGNTALFQPIVIASEIWKESGWGTIIYLAAITRISVDLYEAARIDGATRFQQIVHITLSGIKDIVVVMLIMRIGNILNVGFEQILVLQNDMVLRVGDTLDTYVWRVGLQNSRFSYAAAAGLFKAVIATVMIFAADRASKSVGEAGLL